MRWTVFLKGLLSDDEADRIDALKELSSSEDVDWVSTTRYFEEALNPSSKIDFPELRLAVEVAVQTPLRAVHEMVVELADKGAEDERAEAVMGLARIGEARGEELLEILTRPR